MLQQEKIVKKLRPTKTNCVLFQVLSRTRFNSALRRIMATATKNSKDFDNSSVSQTFKPLADYPTIYWNDSWIELTRLNSVTNGTQELEHFSVMFGDSVHRWTLAAEAQRRHNGYLYRNLLLSLWNEGPNEPTFQLDVSFSYAVMGERIIKQWKKSPVINVDHRRRTVGGYYKTLLHSYDQVEVLHGPNKDATHLLITISYSQTKTNKQ